MGSLLYTYSTSLWHAVHHQAAGGAGGGGRVCPRHQAGDCWPGQVGHHHPPPPPPLTPASLLGWGLVLPVWRRSAAILFSAAVISWQKDRERKRIPRSPLFWWSCTWLKLLLAVSTFHAPVLNGGRDGYHHHMWDIDPTTSCHNGQILLPAFHFNYPDSSACHYSPAMLIQTATVLPVCTLPCPCFPHP